jgi:hypothetical protein
MNHMAFKIVGNLHVIVVGEKDPAPSDWDAYIHAIQASMKAGAEPRQLRTLVFSDGGGPNSAQRKAVANLLNGQATPVAIVSNSAVMRGIMTALAWFNPLARAYAPGEIGDALAFLGVPERSFDSIRDTARGLQGNLGLSRVKALEDARLGSRAVAASRA